MTSCRDCRFCTFQPGTDAAGAKSSHAMCGRVHLSADYARKDFAEVVVNLPMLDPAHWCGPSAARFEARAA